MIYRIYEQDSENLLEKPETGMGYQIINAAQYNMRFTRKFVVYNTNLAVELDSDFLVNKRLIMNEGYKFTLNKVPELVLETNSIEVLTINQFENTLLYQLQKEIFIKGITVEKEQQDSAREFANGKDIYTRVSAYEDDKRIDFLKKRLKPGTFTTTFEDYADCLTTNDDPIDRYALPNDEKIKWAFFIQPKSVDTLQKGIVQPAFGHVGGGIEAYFEKGTSENTYALKREYGK